MSERYRLTRRQQSVLQGLGRGLPPAEIAAELGITVQTCRGHIKTVLTKLGAHTQLQAVVIAAHEGLLQNLVGRE